MLQHTFCHIARISPRMEAALWAAGVTTWDDAQRADLPKVPRINNDRLRAQIEESATALQFGRPHYFAERLPAHLHWRWFPDFRTRCAYLDIETTGMSIGSDRISTVTLYDGTRIRWYVSGLNLDDFIFDVQEYDVLVTYNGKSFDIPFLENAFHTTLPHAQIDLRHTLSRLGYTGGLKKCERALGLERGELTGVDGFMAVALWKDYARSGRDAALQTLLSYNIQDVLNLEPLLVIAYNLNVQRTPFAAARLLPPPEVPVNPFAPDPELVEQLKDTYSPRYDPWHAA